MLFVPEIAESAYTTVTGTSQQFATAMVAGELFEFVPTVGCYIAQGANPTASAGAGSMYVPANVPVLIENAFGAGAKLAVIREAGSGAATLTRLRARNINATKND